jgi:DNA-binding MarR family transcriptional regulator
MDRRKSIVSISDQGLDLIATHAAQSKALFRNLEQIYGKKDMETLLDLLDKLQKIRL